MPTATIGDEPILRGKDSAWFSFIRPDKKQSDFATQYQARTPASQALYLFLHLLPGLLAYVLINVPAVHAAVLNLTHLPTGFCKAAYWWRSPLAGMLSFHWQC